MYYNHNTVVFFNGEWMKASDLHLSAYTQTLHYGNGVFEGIRSYETAQGAYVFKSKEHYERLHYSAGKMFLNLNYSPDQLGTLTLELLKKNNLSNAYIRPLVFAGEAMGLKPSSEANLLLCAWHWDKLFGNDPVRVTFSPYRRPDPLSCHVEAKVCGHYTNSILATTEAKHRGFDEALLCDAKGFVAEGPGANFFFEKAGKLFTPPAGNILPGITRATLLDLCKELELEFEERHVTPDEVMEADSAFFAGTAAEVAPIASLEGREFPLTWEDSLGAVLQNAYSKLVRLEPYNYFSLV